MNMDMSEVIIPRSDQINSDDLIGGPMTITILEVQIKGGQEQPVSIYFEGSDKAFRPCKSMSRILVSAWGPDAKAYVGRSLTLYRDPTVKWGGMEVGGIRISHMSHLARAMTMALTATKGSRKPFVVNPMDGAPAAKGDDRQTGQQSKSEPKDQPKAQPKAQGSSADRAKDGAKTLVARINSVEPKNLSNITSDPVVVKQRTWLAANLPDLAREVDDAIDRVREAAEVQAPASDNAAETGDPFAETDPEPAAAKADEIIAEMARCETPGEVDRMLTVNDTHLAFMPEDLAEKVRAAALARVAEMT